MTPQEKQQLDELLAWKRSLENASSIPLSVDQAFRKRFISGLNTIQSSSHSGETTTVNESGAGNYAVMSPADGFAQTELPNGTTIYIPYFL